MLKQTTLAALTVALMSLLVSADVYAFCGFYVSGANTKLYNNATQVVMMREGTKTVLSMQNNYEGPPKDFAMVVPVPVVLKEEHVKTLEQRSFDKIDQLASPRLVEYFEQDPCYNPPVVKYKKRSAKKQLMLDTGSAAPPQDLGVTVEAQFAVGEYEVVVLSAKESNGLETWLTQNKYNIPTGAASVLAGYIQQGMYFFVAKVNIKKVKYKQLGGKKVAVLSPLRFHYDSDNFSLPVRLGLLNAKGDQDLIVHILAKQRYEAANMGNVTIPTNLIVDQSIRKSFAQFYTALFDYTLEQNPGAMVTEYAWDPSTCDPCPGPTLDGSDLQVFGYDAIHPETSSPNGIYHREKRYTRPMPSPRGWVLTRLHTRYNAKTLKDDIVFKATSPVVGGRGTPEGLEGKMHEEGATLGGSYNNFQGRYIMLNPWKGKIACENPRRGSWGGPPTSKKPAGPMSAQDLAYTPRGKVKLSKVIKSKDAPGLKLDKSK